MASVRFCKRRGFALIAVLWLLVLLSMIALYLSAASRSDADLTRQLVNAARSAHATDAGVRWALWRLSLPREDQWLADGTIQLMEFEGAAVRVALEDENGKYDLNQITAEQLMALFDVIGVEEEKGRYLTDAILDWRDEDNLKRLNGAEDEDYLAAGLDYGARDALFEEVAEVRQVLGMDQQTYRMLAPALTVHSRKQGINAWVAPRIVLLSLPGASEAMVDDYIAARRFNHQEGLPPPPNPPLEAQLISPTLQGVYYTIHTDAKFGEDSVSGLKMLIRRRGNAPTTHFDLLTISYEKELLFSGAKP